MRRYIVSSAGNMPVAPVVVQSLSSKHFGGRSLVGPSFTNNETEFFCFGHDSRSFVGTAATSKNNPRGPAEKARQHEYAKPDVNSARYGSGETNCDKNLRQESGVETGQKLVTTDLPRINWGLKLDGRKQEERTSPNWKSGRCYRQESGAVGFAIGCTAVLTRVSTLIVY